MTEPIEPDVADVVARVGRHWGWILAFGIITLLAGIAVLAWPGRSVWLLFFGLMEITAAFRLRSVGHRARARAVHAT
jgi:uncharacterized membrane protein HdeD (DUF308 family)